MRLVLLEPTLIIFIGSMPGIFLSVYRCICVMWMLRGLDLCRPMGGEQHHSIDSGINRRMADRYRMRSGFGLFGKTSVVVVVVFVGWCVVVLGF